MGYPMPDVVWDVPYVIIGYPIACIWDILWDVPTFPRHIWSYQSSSVWTCHAWISYGMSQVLFEDTPYHHMGHHRDINGDIILQATASTFIPLLHLLSLLGAASPSLLLVFWTPQASFFSYLPPPRLYISAEGIDHTSIAICSLFATILP